MAQPLAGIREKVHRANLQIGVLDAETKTWIDKQSREIAHDHNAKTGIHEFGIRIPTEPPIGYGVALGEIVHNLRSALDNLVWELARSHGKRPPSMSAFPITTNRWDFVGPRDKPPRHQAMIAGLTREEQALVKGCQPYLNWQQARSHPLFILNTLWNADKHRTVHPAVAAAEFMPPEVIFRVTALDDGTIGTLYAQNYVGMPINETGIMRVKVNPPTLRLQVEMKSELPLGIAFGKPPLTGFGDLYVIGETVRFIVEEIFAPRFP